MISTTVGYLEFVDFDIFFYKFGTFSRDLALRFAQRNLYF